ncbi:putative elongator complex protein 1 [Coemansia sp. RSA 2599]|nr:putative elongator complex protein 1 [Coemansia sp. RSA 2598]KAJ1828614.1 putative elongator complex protein 1 [Coemansia sp. RSA 2599]
MRNLSLLSEVIVAVPDSNNYYVLATWNRSSHSISDLDDDTAAQGASWRTGGPTAAVCVDVTEGKTYVLLGDASSDAAYLASVSSGDEPKMHIVAELPLSASQAQIAGMQFIMERECVFLALRSGDIMTVDVAGASADVDIVGTVDSGVMSCAWSPDGELLALVTGEAKLLLMTQEFDVVDEFELARDDQGEVQHVALGWGTKATQYHGKAGKQAALEDTAVRQALGSADDDYHVRISWRGDGDFFAVSFVAAGGRQIRVFSREGKLHSIGEKILALEHPLAWKPSGRLVAATEKLEHRHDVVFFERNGLRHGEFTLRPCTRRVLDLAWNADSSVLAVLAMVETSAGLEEPCVELWADKNYHWYLKQELRSSTFGDWISHVVWDSESTLGLHVVGRTRYARIAMHAAPVVARVASDESNAAACVVDGDRLLYTPFAVANVPPPMALHTLPLGSPAAHVAFSGFGSGNAFAALLADRRTVALFEAESAASVADEKSPVELRPRVSFPHDAAVRQIAWPWPGIVVGLGEHRRVYVLDIDSGATREYAVGDKQVSLLVSAPHAQTVILQASDGQVWRMDAIDDGASRNISIGDGGCRFSIAGQLPAACVQIDAAEVDGSLVILGRTERNQLFANDRLLSSVCSSFYLRRDLLLFTTTTHYLRFVPVDADMLTSAAAPLEDAGAQVAKYDESQRRVERGSTIVLASPVGENVVFQMPRGNLETVRPRAMVLAVVRRALDSRRYRDALVACRVNRIDMNIIHDHCADQLMQDLAEFVEQINDSDLLNLFVSGLRDEDVTKTMYAGLKASKAESLDAAAAAVAAHETNAAMGKATRVCQMLRPVLQQADAQRYMPTILTTFVCQTPPDIPAALRLLAPLSADERDKALTYLLFLSDVDTVYDAALGLYDLPLALLVAQRSQRDPREYLTALGALNKLSSEEYRRFKIDAQLGRSELALEHLCAAYNEQRDLWPEVVGYVQETALYPLAMRHLASVDQARFREMSELFGDYQAQLPSSGASAQGTGTAEWGQAAASYMLAGAHAKAIGAFVQAKEWRAAMALACAPDASGSSSAQAIHDVAVRASAVLADSHLFMDAATVLLEYTEEDEDAVALLVRGGHWAEAVRSALLRDRADLIETTVRPGLARAYESLEEDIGEIREALAGKCGRLREVRSKPLEMIVERQAALALGGSAADDASLLDNIDVMSDTTSLASKFSTFTGTVTNASSRMTGSTARRISKNKRKKEERRKVRGKKGSIYEESYLVDSISKLIDRVRVNQTAVREMSWALMRAGQLVQAAELQETFGAVVAFVLDNADFVFDQQRVQMRLGENGVPEPMPLEVNEFGVASQPKHPKPVLPGYQWRYEALAACAGLGFLRAR